MVSYHFLEQACNCGKLYPSENVRIIGGESVTRNTYPWVVALFSGTRDENNNIDIGSDICGGTIITKNHVLTAAICLYNENGELDDASNIFVAYGEFDLRSFTESVDDDWYTEVLKIDLHPKYNSNNREDNRIFNAAILTLRSEIDSQVGRGTLKYFY